MRLLAMHYSLTGKSYVVSDNSELELLLLFLLSIEIALAFPLFERWRYFQHNERDKELFEERWDDLKRLQTNIEYATYYENLLTAISPSQLDF